MSNATAHVRRDLAAANQFLPLENLEGERVLPQFEDRGQIEDHGLPFAGTRRRNRVSDLQLHRQQPRVHGWLEPFFAQNQCLGVINLSAVGS